MLNVTGNLKIKPTNLFSVENPLIEVEANAEYRYSKWTVTVFFRVSQTIQGIDSTLLGDSFIIDNTAITETGINATDLGQLLEQSVVTYLSSFNPDCKFTINI